MADDQQSASGMVPAMVEAFTGQLRAVTEGLEELAGLSQRARPAAGVFPLPGALSAAQLASLADSIAAQRRSIEALTAQLSSFDEQLAALEQILGPLAQWSATWAELEQRLLNLGRGAQGPGRASGSSPDSSLSGDPLGFRRRRPAARDLSAAGTPLRRAYAPHLRHDGRQDSVIGADDFMRARGGVDWRTLVRQRDWGWVGWVPRLAGHCCRGGWSLCSV